MLENQLYAFSKLIIRIGTRIFFQEIQVRNREQIPPEGPFIITSNHPNDKLDALIIGRSVPRKINFLAAGFLFKYKLLSWIMRSTGTIPVYRKNEHADANERNVKSFDACYQVLENGGAIGIFPEGLTHLDRQVKKVKTGTARIAFEAEQRNQWKLGLKIIPVGLNFYHPTRIRGKIFVNFGRPILVSQYRTMYEQDPEKAIYQLTNVIHEKIQQHIIHLNDETTQQLLSDLEHIYKGELVKQLSREQQEVSPFMVSRRLADAIQYYYDHDPVKVAEVWGKIENYKNKLKIMGVGETMVREYRHRGVIWRGLGALLITILGMPIALYGWINSLPGIILTLIFSQTRANRLTKIALTKFMSGLVIFPLMYALQIITFSRFFDSHWTWLYALSLPLTGYFALFFRDKFKPYKRDIYQAYVHLTKRPLILILKKERLKLIQYLDNIKEEYLAVMEANSPPA